RSGTVLSMELEATDLKSGKTKRYYSAFLGEHQVDPDATNRSFAPLSIGGHGTFTDTVRFYPIGNPLPKLVEDAGDFHFTLKLVTADPQDPDLMDRLVRKTPSRVAFERTLRWIPDQQLGNRRIAIPMNDRSWNPAAAPPEPVAQPSAEAPAATEPQAPAAQEP